MTQTPALISPTTRRSKYVEGVQSTTTKLDGTLERLKLVFGLVNRAAQPILDNFDPVLIRERGEPDTVLRPLILESFKLAGTYAKLHHSAVETQGPASLISLKTGFRRAVYAYQIQKAHHVYSTQQAPSIAEKGQFAINVAQRITTKTISTASKALSRLSSCIPKPPFRPGTP